MNQILFLHPCKTGGNSIKEVIHKLGGINCDPRTNGLHWHARMSDIKKKFNLSKYFVVTTTRCPFRRAVSHYEYHKNTLKMKEAVEYDFNKFFSDEFRPQYVNDYFFPCWEYAKYADFIINFETLQRDFNKLCQLYKQKVSLPHSNKVSYKKDTESLKTRFNQETIDYISEVFIDDIAYFGYSFENIGA